MTKMNPVMFRPVKPGMKMMVYVSAGGRALFSNEYVLSVQQRQQEDAPPVASDLRCVYSSMYLAVLCVEQSDRCLAIFHSDVSAFSWFCHRSFFVVIFEHITVYVAVCIV
jgi:hypothetical protein